MKEPQLNNWEKEFDEKFSEWFLSEEVMAYTKPTEIKEFIKSIESQTYKDGFNKGCQSVRYKIQKARQDEREKFWKT